jgi:hypothetical protein
MSAACRAHCDGGLPQDVAQEYVASRTQIDTQLETRVGIPDPLHAKAWQKQAEMQFHFQEREIFPESASRA